MSIQVNDVVVGYSKDITILNGVSIKAEEKKVTCIIGPNGSGKSTLLKTIYGFLKPSRGTVFFDGKEITGREPCSLSSEGITFIPQRFAIFPQLTVKENLQMATWIFRNDRSRVEKYVNDVYSRFPRLQERKSVPAGRMSGGEQRMLDLARALVVKPKAILLDEPTAGLAPKVAKEVYQSVSELSNEGITLLLVDQNISKGVEISDYVYCIKNGRISDEGAKDKFSGELRELIQSWLI
jgi:branched-chain amino acid transport system ATP-binding protein